MLNARPSLASSTTCTSPPSSTSSSSLNETLSSLSFLQRINNKENLQRYVPPKGARYIFPDGTWTNQEYKGAVRRRVDGQAYTQMTKRGRKDEAEKEGEENDGHAGLRRQYWGMSRTRFLDEDCIDPEFLRSRGKTDSFYKDMKDRDNRNWFLLDEEGRKWDMRMVPELLRDPRTVMEMNYSDFWLLLQEGHVERVKYTSDRNHLWVWTKPDAPRGVSMNRIGLPYDPDLYNELIRNDVKIEITVASPVLVFINGLMRVGLPMVVAAFVYRVILLTSDMDDEDKPIDVRQYGRSKFSMRDIGGIEDIEDEIEEVIDYLRAPRRYAAVGATPPQGVMLRGPPGCGKTLLAQCLAGESKVPFLAVSSTYFNSMFGGSGAAAVRHLWSEARRIAPCIIFIDEFDGVGARRGNTFDNQTHTINQMLTELDGFAKNTGIVLIVATNRPDVLDPALSRPGRIDRNIDMPPPKRDGRAAIMKIHAQTRKVDPNINWDKMARATGGYTGAKLRKVINDTATSVSRRGGRMITEDDILREIASKEDQSGWGPVEGQLVTISSQAKIDMMPEEFKKGVALYEAGKVIVTNMCEDFDEVNKTILFPQGASTGRTIFLPQEDYQDTGTFTREYVENRLVQCMAGIAAQQLVLGRHNVVETKSGREDIKMANLLARQMILRLGFNKRVGPVSLMGAGDVIRGQELSAGALDQPIAEMSEEMAALVTVEVRELLDAAEAKAYYGLICNYKGLVRLSRQLLRRKFMTGDAMRRVVEGEEKEETFTCFGDFPLLEYGFGDDNRLEVPNNDANLQRVLDAVKRGRRIGVMDGEEEGKMANPAQIDATKDLMAWLLAGGQEIDVVDRSKPLDPWVQMPGLMPGRNASPGTNEPDLPIL